MEMARNSAIVVFLGLIITGCATTGKSMFDDVTISKAEQAGGMIYRGMSIESLEQILGRQPVCIWTDVCRTDHLPDGDYFTWVVGGGGHSSNWEKTYTFTFKNDQLVSWGSN